MGLSERLNKVMKELDLSQVQIADKTDVTRQNISNIINKKSNPSVEWVRKLVLAFPVIDCKWFVTGEGEMLIDSSKSEYDQSENKAQLNDVNLSSACENCKRLNSYIERQERLIERLERQLGHDVPDKKGHLKIIWLNIEPLNNN